MGVDGMAGLPATCFEGDVARFVDNMSSAADALVATTARLTDRSREPHCRASLAAAARSLGHSLDAIVRQLAEVPAVGDDEVMEPADEARRTGEIGALIADIAGQTNLLALEALIVEAARAADIGEELPAAVQTAWDAAMRTAEASDEIARRIAEVQRCVLQVADVVAGVTRS